MRKIELTINEAWFNELSPADLYALDKYLVSEAATIRNTPAGETKKKKCWKIIHKCRERVRQLIEQNFTFE